MSRLAKLAGAAVAGYALGTIPFADLAARRGSDGRIDLREWGSGNPGAMNVLLTFGPTTGIAVAVADAGKGVLACFAGRALAGDTGAHVAGVAAVVGHCYPPRSRRGGKGIATSAGQLVATFPAFAPLEAVGRSDDGCCRPAGSARQACAGDDRRREHGLDRGEPRLVAEAPPQPVGCRADRCTAACERRFERRDHVPLLARNPARPARRLLARSVIRGSS